MADDVDVVVSGPIFDGRARTAAERACDDIEEQVTLVAARYVREGTVVFRNPTGRARSSVRVVKRAKGRVIRDGGLVYWPWLEDGKQKMRRNTRFKGYKIWGSAEARIRAEGGEIARRRLPHFVREMGG